VSVDKRISEAFYNSLQQCKISLMSNGELIIVPEAVRCGDVVSMFAGADSPCVIRPDGQGGWTLISGDCFVFTEQFLSHGTVHGDFWCGTYVKRNQDKVEEFVLR
jgi:hypothetical protein